MIRLKDINCTLTFLCIQGSLAITEEEKKYDEYNEKENDEGEREKEKKEEEKRRKRKR